MKTTFRKNQQGAVLVVGLLLLLIMTLIGVTSMTGSSMQEQLAGSAKKRLEAQLGAEAGMAAAIKWFESNPNKWPLANATGNALVEWKAGLPYSTPTSANFGDRAAYKIDVTWSGDQSGYMQFARITSTGYVVASGAQLSQVELKMAYQPLIQAGSTENSCNKGNRGNGLLSDKNVDLNEGKFDNNVHANGNVDISADTIIITGAVSAVGTVANKGTLGSTQNNAPAIDVPKVKADLKARLLAAAQTNGIVSNACNGDAAKNGSPAGSFNSSYLDSRYSKDAGGYYDFNGGVVYCTGKIDFPNIKMKNVTIFTESTDSDSVYLNGGVDVKIKSSDNVTANSAIITMGGVDFKGNAEFLAGIWANGTVNINGGSAMDGYIMARDKITLQGNWDFMGTDVNNPYLQCITTNNPPVVSSGGKAVLNL